MMEITVQSAAPRKAQTESKAGKTIDMKSRMMTTLTRMTPRIPLFTSSPR